MISLSFDTRAIERQIRGLMRFRDSMPEIVAGEVVRQVREFAGSGRNPDGTAWPKLTPAYAARKAKMGLPAVPNKRVTGGFLSSVKNRDMVVAPDAQHVAQGMGLEKKRKSFEVSPVTAGNVERLLLKAFNEL